MGHYITVTIENEKVLPVENIALCKLITFCISKMGPGRGDFFLEIVLGY